MDVNLLLYATNHRSPRHAEARAWWWEQLGGTEPVCLCWAAVLGFIRISTNRRIYEQPLTVPEAVSVVRSWLAQPCVRLVHPTERHWSILQTLLEQGQAAGNLVSDAHLAALAVAHGCVLCSTDADFARFPRLKWVNPLRSGS